MPEKTNGADRVWFVTGASSGFGEAVCKEVLARGDALVATGREPDALRPLVAEGGEKAVALALDVTDESAAHETVADAVDRFGRVDVVFNNAGYGHIGAAEELSEEELKAQVDVNFFGVINVTRAALPHMRKQRSGHFLQMSSLNGVEGLPGASYYAASKFAVEGFSESLADEVEPLGIKVTIVEPGPHRTAFLSEQSAKWSKPIDDYAQTVGQARDMLHELDGNQPGDPARAARAIAAVAESPNPPRRLPLGQMAVDHIRAKLENQLSELDRVAKLSATSDFPD
jgi:NAD(P)-dependent dehydrogenase (short-subunit alcohol dehydrogenase family)